jgi:hypothetical protein
MNFEWNGMVVLANYVTLTQEILVSHNVTMVKTVFGTCFCRIEDILFFSQTIRNVHYWSLYIQYRPSPQRCTRFHLASPAT